VIQEGFLSPYGHAQQCGVGQEAAEVGQSVDVFKHVVDGQPHACHSQYLVSLGGRGGDVLGVDPANRLMIFWQCQ